MSSSPTTTPRDTISGTPTIAPVPRLMPTTATMTPSAGQVAPVAQHLVADLAHARHVEEHASGRRAFGDARAGLVEVHHVAVLRQQHVHLAAAAAQHLPGDARVLRQLAVFAVDGHEVARPHQRQDELQFLLGAVAGHVHALRCRP